MICRLVAEIIWYIRLATMVPARVKIPSASGLRPIRRAMPVASSIAIC